MKKYSSLFSATEVPLYRHEREPVSVGQPLTKNKASFRHRACIHHHFSATRPSGGFHKGLKGVFTDSIAVCLAALFVFSLRICLWTGVTRKVSRLSCLKLKNHPLPRFCSYPKMKSTSYGCDPGPHCSSDTTFSDEDDSDGTTLFGNYTELISFAFPQTQRSALLLSPHDRSATDPVCLQVPICRNATIAASANAIATGTLESALLNPKQHN